jgi:hypothetical protein
MRAQKISKFARRRNGEAASERARQGKRREGRKGLMLCVRRNTQGLEDNKNPFFINFQKQNKLHKHNNQFLFFLLARWQIGKIVFACWFVVVVAAAVVMLPLLCYSCAGMMRALHCERRRSDRDDNDDYQHTNNGNNNNNNEEFTQRFASIFIPAEPPTTPFDGWMDGWMNG